MIDSKLKFQNHIKIIESKLSRSVGILYRLKAVLPREAVADLGEEMGGDASPHQPKHNEHMNNT